MTASSPKKIFRPWLRLITDLRLAIFLLLAIALFSISGTIIEQGQSLSFYQTNYPEDPALFGFLTWKILLTIGLNHVYSTWWFLSILVLFGTSLTACTFTRQFPALKSARRWKHYDKPRQFEKLALSTELDGSIDTLIPLLKNRNYKIFQEGNTLYARKGIIGRIGPIIVHAAMLIILAGAIWGITIGFIAQEMVASGNTFKINNIFEAGPLSASQVPQDWEVKVNRFWIDYTADGTIDQFYSDLSVVDLEGKELKQETIHVNKPLRYDGVTLYQTNWGIAGVQVQFNNSPIFQIPMTQLIPEEQGKLWGAWIPTNPDLSEGVALLTKDLQGTLMVYNGKGEFVGVIRPGMGIEINGITLKLIDLIGSTGLQIKADPGIPLVYTGFGLLMLGVLMSYVSHSQVWALETLNSLYVGGKTNRALVTFEREILEIIAQMDTLETVTTNPTSPQPISVNSEQRNI